MRRLVLFFFLLAGSLYSAGQSIAAKLDSRQLTVEVQNMGMRDAEVFRVRYYFERRWYSVDGSWMVAEDGGKPVSITLQRAPGSAGFYGTYPVYVEVFSRVKNSFSELSTRTLQLVNTGTNALLAEDEKIILSDFAQTGTLRIVRLLPDVQRHVEIILPPTLSRSETKDDALVSSMTLTETGSHAISNQSLTLLIEEERLFEGGKAVHFGNIRNHKFSTGKRFEKSTIDFFTLSTSLLILILMVFVYMSWYSEKKKNNREAGTLWLTSGLMMLFAYLVYFQHYDIPRSMFWDENYYITAVEKYRNGVFFMEGHFPLGKIIMALGEWIFHPNEGLDTSYMWAQSYTSTLPASYSFIGIRFFPVLAAMGCSFLGFYILYLLTKNAWASLLLSFFFLFDNAQVLQYRGAMLDSIQLFFIMLFAAFFLRAVLSQDTVKKRLYFWLGAAAGAAFAVKENGGIILLLFPFLAWRDFEGRLHVSKANAIELIKKASLAAAGLAVIFGLSWQVHFILGTSFYNGSQYTATEELKKVVQGGGTANPLNFPLQFKEHMSFIENYHKGVPKLDPCKDGENGSHPIFWAVGKKSIHYSWNKNGDRMASYTLQINPVIWFTGLFALALALSVLFSRFIFGQKLIDERRLLALAGFFTLYAVYMVLVLQADRVLYLYHYFIPLSFTLIMGAIIFSSYFTEPLKKDEPAAWLGVFFLSAAVLAAFLFFSPFTYGQWLDRREFMQRVWFDVWQLNFIR